MTEEAADGPGAPRYAAFISYSQKDQATAAWLHRKLERFAIPTGLAPERGVKTTFGRRLGKVFRDREEFTAGREINEQIHEALRDAAAVIVLCSPNAVLSPYVSNEVRYFRERGRGKVIPVIVDGEPPDCFPESLRDQVDILGADFRDGKDGREAGFIKIVAGLLDVPADALFQRERRRQRILIAQFGAAAIAFAGLAVAAGVLGVMAQRNALIAEERAATLSIDAARTQAREGDADGALLMLLDAARVLGRAGRPAPDSLLIAFDDALQRAGAVNEVETAAGARYFQARAGVFAAAPDGALSLVTGAEAPVAIGDIDGPALLVAEDEDGSVIALREDQTIFRIEAGAARILGRLEGPLARSGEAGLASGNGVYLRDGVLAGLPATPAGAAPENGDDVIAAFDLRTGAGAILHVPHFSARVTRNALGALETFTLVQEDGWERFAAWCGVDPTIPAFGALVEDMGNLALLGDCVRVGEAAHFTFWTFGSGGQFRTERFIGGATVNMSLGEWESGEEPARQLGRFEDAIERLIGGTLDYVVGRIEGEYAAADTTWVALDPGSETLAVAVDRTLLRIGDLQQAQEYRFSAPITFAGFLPEGRIAVAAGDGALRIVDPAAASKHGVAGPLPEGEWDAVREERNGRCIDLSYPDAPAPDGEAPLLRLTAEGQRAFVTFTRSGRVHAIDHHLDACLLLFNGGANLIARGETAAVVYDVARLDAEGPQAAQLATLPESWRNTLTPVQGESSVLAADGPTVKLYALPEAPTTTPLAARRLFQGDQRVIFADYEPSSQRLIVGEDLGGSTLGFLVYSVQAQQAWRRLGAAYKWFFAWWREDGTIGVSDPDTTNYVVALSTLEAARAAALAALPQRCRTFTGETYRASPCWPAAIR